jgi:hypothetical protein
MRRAGQMDMAAIVRLLDWAFALSQFESRLVRALVENGRPIHHWVLEDEGMVKAYVC